MSSKVAKIFTKKIIILATIIILLPIFATILADNIVKLTSKNYLYSDILLMPENKVGLVLGTSKYLSNGRINLYYKYRIEAATALYKAGKIKYIVVSGDNSRKTYDEPTQMKDDLIAGGVPNVFTTSGRYILLKDMDLMLSDSMLVM